MFFCFLSKIALVKRRSTGFGSIHTNPQDVLQGATADMCETPKTKWHLSSWLSRCAGQGSTNFHFTISIHQLHVASMLHVAFKLVEHHYSKRYKVQKSVQFSQHRYSEQRNMLCQNTWEPRNMFLLQQNFIIMEFVIKYRSEYVTRSIVTVKDTSALNNTLHRQHYTTG